MPSDPIKRFWFVLAVIAVLALMFLSDALFDKPQRADRLVYINGGSPNRLGTYDKELSDLYVRARQAMDDGYTDRAEEIYREITAKYPKDPESFNSLGACLYFERKYSAAKTPYLHALELDPQSSVAYYGLGCIAYEQGHLDEAKDNLEKALLQNEKDSLCHRLLGMVWEESGDAPKAIAHYERAIALDSSLAKDPEITHRLHILKSAIPPSPAPAPTTN